MVWRSEDVVACDDFSGLRDLYCKMWMETDSKKKRDTDTHWRCRNGKVHKNWARRRVLSFEGDQIAAVLHSCVIARILPYGGGRTC